MALPNLNDYVKEFDEVLASLKSIGTEIKQIESELEKYGAPYTSVRFPEWKRSK